MNETNAALSALRSVASEMNLATDVNSPMALAWSLRIAQTIALLEASQREAPVAQDFIEKFLSQMSHTEVGGVPMDYWDRTLTLRFVEDVRRRLAERPSVTNVSRGILDVIYDRATRALADPADGDVMALTDICNIIEAAPAPGKAADEGVE